MPRTWPSPKPRRPNPGDHYVSPAQTLSGDDTSHLSGPVNERNVKIPFVDERGFTRIGPQPRPPAIQVKWAPKKALSTKLKYAVGKLFSNTDKKMKTRNPKDYDAEKLAIYNKLIKSYAPYDSSDKTTRVCDYTRVEISFGPGPQSSAIEAIYPYIMVGSIAYHTTQNVCVISNSLNWTKGKTPQIYLPLLAAWVNAHDMDIDFEERKRRCTWIFNTLLNTAIIRC